MEKKLWEPTPSDISNSHIYQYLHWVKKKFPTAAPIKDYESLHRWSVEHPKTFWESLWEYFDIISHHPYEEVSDDLPMPDTKWFSGAKLNYAEHIFRHSNPDHPALIAKSETRPVTEISRAQLRDQTALVQKFLLNSGLKPGDRVAAYLPNIPEATISFLATISLGGIWSSCSPDFGADSVLDRFQQIRPKVLITAAGYSYNGKKYNRQKITEQLAEEIPSLEKIIVIPYPEPDSCDFPDDRFISWDLILQGEAPKLTFVPVEFSHPIWILYSSGTTGAPKAITHSHGGMLLEHLKYMAFHNDVHPGERFFWYSTTGWMMWNFVQASLLAGATAVLYDGSPAHPDLNALWQFAEETGIHHFGISAPFIIACMKEGLQPGKKYNLSSIRSIGSTGSPLPPAGFDWIYENVHRDVWLCSMSGGTDVCTAFVGGCILKPVVEGWIQCRGLGVALYSYDEKGQQILNEPGEMVITEAMPAMPVYFWNDPEKTRYKESYFSVFPGVWRHGDWVIINEEGMLKIAGRSDATLNRHGIRIGTAEIYQVLNRFEEIEDSLIINLELENGNHFMPLFVKMKPDKILTDGLKERIRQQLRTTNSPRHVPDKIIQVPHIPYTISGKKMEAPVKKILSGANPGSALNPDAMRNPESIDFYKSLVRHPDFTF